MRIMTIIGLLALAGVALGAERSWKPNPMRMGNNAANELFEQQKYDEALKMYLDYYGQKTGKSQDDPDLGALAYNIGNAYTVLGDAEKAREFYEKASRSSNREAVDRARFNMGNLNMQAQQPGEAVKQYVDYLKANPDDVDAKRNLELALRMLEQQQQQQQQQQQNQDQENEDKDQQDQEQNQQNQDQQNQDQQNQDQQNQDQQNQDQQNQDQQDQQDQDQQNQDQQDQQNQDQQDQDQQDQQNQDQEQKEEEKQQQQQQQEQNQDKMTDAMKKQILEALKEQEMQQQKEYQKRKLGTSKRRAKDW